MHTRYSLISLIIGIASISCASAPAKPGGTAAAPAAAAAPAPAQNTSTAPANSELAAREKRTRELIRELASVRGLAEQKPLVISFEDPAAFKASLQKVAAEDQGDNAAEHARWVAFGFAPASADPREVALKVLDEQVAAFYDPKAKLLHVPLDSPLGNGPHASEEQETVLIHEAEHGLQDQHFPFPDLEKVEDDDLLLASKALYEGDATFAMIAVPAARAHALDARRLLDVARGLRNLPISTLEQMSGKASPEMDQAPKIVRDELLFPYFGGFLLAAERFAAGGDAALDQLFQNPPVSTEQVLHPEKYAAGELPVALEAPALPAGAKLLARGKLGELLLRTLLSDCLSDAEAARGSMGWGGDAYLVAQRADGSLLLEWSYAADDPARVPPLAALLERASAAGCFPEVSSGAAGSWSLPAGASIAEARGRVAMVRGFSESEAPATLRALLARPVTRLPARPPPPLASGAAAGAESAGPAPETGAIAEKPAAAPSLDAQRRWSDPQLGLQLTLPPALAPVPEARGLLKVQSGSNDIGVVMMLPMDGPQLRGLLIDAMTRQFAQSFGIEVKAGPALPRRVAGREGSEQILAAPGTPLELHVIFVPLCGKKALLFNTQGLTPAGKAALAAWVDSAALDDGAPVCSAK